MQSQTRQSLQFTGQPIRKIRIKRLNWFFKISLSLILTVEISDAVRGFHLGSVRNWPNRDS